MAIEWYSANWEDGKAVSELLDEIQGDTFSLIDVPDSPRDLNLALSDKFLEAGWAQNFKISGSNLYVSFKRDRTAACVQLGNVARVYADLLKLQNLFDRKTIDNAILIVPSDPLSKEFGANHASFGRTVRDIETLSLSLTCPLLVMSISKGL